MAILDLEKAMKELREKSILDIERATALTWGGRALASYCLSRESATPLERLQRFYEGENYRQEAMEHASMADDGGALMRGIHGEVESERQAALDGLKRALVQG